MILFLLILLGTVALALALLVTVFLLLANDFPNKRRFCTSRARLENKTAIVTGGSHNEWRSQTYEVVSNHCENYHVHDWPGRTWVIDSRQLIPFTFSVQTGQLASLVSMIIHTMVNGTS